VQINEADGVFQGGGVKAIAVVGALLAFAERGCSRWVNLAGASGGAIIAAYLACGHDAYDAEQLLRSAPYPRFADFGPGGPLLGGAWNLARRHGLAQGEYLRHWLDEQLGGRTFAAVNEDGRSRLKLIAADVTRREMLVLPDDLGYYRLPGTSQPIEAAHFRIADAVRMSVSLPYFFGPVELVHHESSTTSTIVDGGLVSSFPVWLFDVEDRDPIRPTFGFRVTGGRGFGSGFESALARLGWPVRLGSDLFHTAMEAWDRRFMSHSTRVRTCAIPSGDIGTTDFQLTPLEQTELVENGRRAARRFLDAFHPGEYRNTYGRRLSAVIAA
jgi:NTE family protein